MHRLLIIVRLQVAQLINDALQQLLRHQERPARVDLEDVDHLLLRHVLEVPLGVTVRASHARVVDDDVDDVTVV